MSRFLLLLCGGLIVLSCGGEKSVANVDLTLTWEKTYGTPANDGAKSAIPTSDGGFVITGWTRDTPTGHEDVYVLKVNAAGNILWEQTFGGDSYDYGWSVIPAEDGGFIVGGVQATGTTSIKNAYLVKVNSAGTPVWEQSFGGGGSDEVYAMIPAVNGYLALGWTRSFGAGLSDVYLFKIDEAGNQQWSQTYGGEAREEGTAIVRASDGGYLITGYTTSFGAGARDVYLLRINESGNSIWTKTFGGTKDDFGYAIDVTPDGGYVIAGATESFGADQYDVYLIKTDAAGDSLWTRVYGGAGDDFVRSVVATADGGLVAVGWTSSFGAGGDDLYLIKIDAQGNLVWEKTFGGGGHDRGWSVRQTSTGGFIIAGLTDSFGAGSGDVYLIKTDADGELQD